MPPTKLGGSSPWTPDMYESSQTLHRHHLLLSDFFDYSTPTYVGLGSSTHSMQCLGLCNCSTCIAVSTTWHCSHKGFCQLTGANFTNKKSLDTKGIYSAKKKKKKRARVCRCLNFCLVNYHHSSYIEYHEYMHLYHRWFASCLLYPWAVSNQREQTLANSHALKTGTRTTVSLIWLDCTMASTNTNQCQLSWGTRC